MTLNFIATSFNNHSNSPSPSSARSGMSNEPTSLGSNKVQVFDDSIFLSRKHLKNFFENSHAIQEVLDEKDRTYTTTTNFDPFGVSEIVEEVKNWFAPFTAFGNRSEATTKLSKITTSHNYPNEEGKVVSNHAPVPQAEIALEMRFPKSIFYLHNNSLVKFDRTGTGICAGSTFWFIYLYLNTKDQFDDPRKLMAALGKQFEKGGGMDPTLLQAINLRQHGYLLNLKIGAAPVEMAEHCPEIDYASNDWRSKSSEIIDQLKTLPSGAYAVTVPLHQMAFIKIDDQLGYYFDPMHGIIEIQGSELMEKLYALISSTLQKMEVGNWWLNLVGRADLRERVDFTPITLLTKLTEEESPLIT
jgi:hypothetical protein